MKSESRPAPAGENSRREFFQKIGTLAAASSLATNAGATPQQTMPMVRFGKHTLSRMVIGCNTLGGLSHLSAMIDVEMKAFNTQEQLLADFKHAEELGINCVESPRPQLIQAFHERGGKMLFTTRNTAPLDESIKPGRGAREIAQSGCIAIHHGGAGETGTDAWWRKGKLDRVREWCKNVRDAGVLVAVTSHRPEVFDIIESQGWDVDYYMTCLYKYGRTPAEWEKSFAPNPGMAPAELYHSREGTSEHYGGETPFVRGDRADMYRIIKQTKKPCFVYKILASGRLCEKEEFVEAAFQETFANIKPSDTVVVGHYTKHLDQYAINAEYVRRFGSNTGTSISPA
jgi:hypothetical protein